MQDKKIKMLGGADTWLEAVTLAAKELEKHITPDCFLLITKDEQGHPATVVSADPAATAYLLTRAIEIIAGQQNMQPLQYIFMLQEFIGKGDTHQTSTKVC
jgi:hypothetical protein